MLQRHTPKQQVLLLPLLLKLTIAGNLSGQIECPIILTHGNLDPLQENSQRIPTGREENIKCNKVLNATSLTCVLYLRNSFLGISLTLPGKSQNLCGGLVKGSSSTALG